MPPESSTYCEHCDLLLAHCVHGAPAPVEPAAAPARATTRRTTKPATARTPRRTVEPEDPSRPSSRVSVKRTTRTRTPQKDFRPHVLAILEEHDGHRQMPEMLADLEERLAEVLIAGDLETSPTGELRWHTAVRFERKSMIDDGLLLPAQSGGWRLNPDWSDAEEL
jgi:hypothetical protein